MEISEKMQCYLYFGLAVYVFSLSHQEDIYILHFHMKTSRNTSMQNGKQNWLLYYHHSQLITTGTVWYCQTVGFGKLFV